MLHDHTVLIKELRDFARYILCRTTCS